ncbi:HTH-type transcriptional regulator GbpR [Pigmentiphaga humi]|uniref:HTH-type transcriptional regulator GbpR n=1 Tax=Pigmentiphaga humi TaxID=2478468 RepID=A0A3P4AXP6_9BURK|nr:LysR substrate-binding domain-containing protein [Pigmentiphaga humi]VCU68160.1 HTH-type transcriptional regulator GbpR [Pigmentiphaga humi]
MSRLLNSRHFQIFTTVMHSRGMAEAALKLGISKAAVSKALSLMERETGVALFTLARGRLEPTAAARRLLPRAEQAAKHLEWALDEAYTLDQGSARSVIVAAHAPPLIAILPSAIQRFRQTHPDANVHLRVEGPPKVLESVAHHEVDLGVTNPPAPNTVSAVDLCERYTISEELLVVVLHRRHPLVAKSVVRPADLVDHTVIALPEESPTSSLVRATLQEAGVVLPKNIVASTSMGVCALVQQNVGIGLINPMLLSTGIFPDIVTRPFRPRIELWTEIYYSSIRPLSPEARALADYIEEAAAALRGYRPIPPPTR